MNHLSRMMRICFPWGRNAGAAWAIEPIYLEEVFPSTGCSPALALWQEASQVYTDPLNTGTLWRAPCSPGTHKNSHNHGKHTTRQREDESSSWRQHLNPKEMAGKANESPGNTNKSCFKVPESPQSQLNNWQMQIKEWVCLPETTHQQPLEIRVNNWKKHRREGFYGSNPKYLNLR